jgi:uncharacterized membrane protein YfcA
LRAFSSGALTGFLGVGRLLGVPALVLRGAADAPRRGNLARGIAMNSFAGLVGHLPLREGTGSPAGFLAVSGAGPSANGLAGRFSQKSLKRVFGFFVLAIGTFLIFRNWTP